MINEEIVRYVIYVTCQPALTDREVEDLIQEVEQYGFDVNLKESDK